MRYIFSVIRMAEQIIHNLSKYMAFIAAAALGVMMLLTTGDVVGRYFFNKPINGTWEIVGLLLIFGGTWGTAYCQKDKSHINVKVLLDLMPIRLQSVILSFAYLTGCVAFSIISWRTALLSKKYYFSSGHATDILHIPMFPFTFALTLGAAVTVLVLLIDFFVSIRKAIRS